MITLSTGHGEAVKQHPVIKNTEIKKIILIAPPLII
jgi:hypothetical protein